MKTKHPTATVSLNLTVEEFLFISNALRRAKIGTGRRKQTEASEMIDSLRSRIADAVTLNVEFIDRAFAVENSKN